MHLLVELGLSVGLVAVTYVLALLVYRPTFFVVAMVLSRSTVFRSAPDVVMQDRALTAAWIGSLLFGAVTLGTGLYGRRNASAGSPCRRG